MRRWLRPLRSGCAAAKKPAAAADAGTTDNPYGIEALWKGSDNIALRC